MSTPSDSIPAPIVSIWQALRFWFKLGWISFGGPAGQISMMHQELVERRQWISDRRFLHALNFTMVLPGPEAQQLATYLGWLMHGTWGGILAGSLFVLPSLLILIGLSWVYLTYGDVAWIAGIFYGIKPAVTAVVVYAAYNIGKKFLKNAYLIALAFAAFIGLFVFNLPFPWIVIGAALLGWGLAHYVPHALQTEPQSTPEDCFDPPSTPRRLSQTLKPLAIGLLLWGAVLLGLAWGFGWQSALIDMGLFFTKMALVTFGGAYAVLPYVQQAGVETYGWLSAPQMLDAMALGETTPGPLIMVVAFVGFLGGWTEEVAGASSLFLSGALAATVVTFFTFLPSFLFILIGAPWIEASRQNLKLTAPLMAISAAVVGVILDLALFFAYHVFWPNGLENSVDSFAVLLSLLAFIGLLRFKFSIVQVILGCGLIGMTYQLI